MRKIFVSLLLIMSVFGFRPMYGKFINNGRKEILNTRKIGIIIPLTIKIKSTNTNSHIDKLYQLMQDNEKSLLFLAKNELTHIQATLKKRKIDFFPDGIKIIRVSMPVDNTALWLGNKKQASQYYKAVRNALSDTDVHAVLMFIPVITSTYKNNGYQYWHQQQVSGQFVIKSIHSRNSKVKLKTIWKSKYFPIIELDKPDFKLGRVRMRSEKELLDEMNRWSSPDKKQKTIRTSFTELKNLGGSLFFFMNFGAFLGATVPDQDYLKAYNSTLSAYFQNEDTSVFFTPAFYINSAFRLNEHFFLGFSLNYLIPFDRHSKTYSDTGDVAVNSTLNGFYPALYLGLDLKHKANSLTLLTLEPGVLFGKLNQSETIAGQTYDTSLSGIGYGVFLGLEYIEHSGGDFGFGQAGFTYSLKFSGGVTYINQFSDSRGNKAYIQNDNGTYGLYLANQNTVLPNSKLMEMFNYYFGIQAAIGFGL